MLSIKNKTFSLKKFTTTIALVSGIWGFSSLRSLEETGQFNFVVDRNATINATSALETTLYLSEDRTYNHNLVAQESGTIDGINIPVGATIVGEYVPGDRGLYYVAKAVINGTTRYPISAMSKTLTNFQQSEEISLNAIAEKISIDTFLEDVNSKRVIVIEPNQSISLFDS